MGLKPIPWLILRAMRFRFDQNTADSDELESNDTSLCAVCPRPCRKELKSDIILKRHNNHLLNSRLRRPAGDMKRL